MGLALAAVPHRGGGVQAALASLRASAAPPGAVRRAA
jgi:hypothetical protein